MLLLSAAIHPGSSSIPSILIAVSDLLICKILSDPSLCPYFNVEAATDQIRKNRLLARSDPTRFEKEGYEKRVQDKENVNQRRFRMLFIQGPMFGKILQFYIKFDA